MTSNKFIHMYVDIYKYNVYVSFYQTNKQLKKELKHLDLNKEEIDFILNSDAGAICCSNASKQLCIIRLIQESTPNVVMSNLTHELFHATCFILKNVGMVLDDSSEEAYAYLLGYLTKTVLEHV